MDESSFDRMTRTFATSRRQALKLALGALAAALVGPASGASAARRGFPGPPNPFEPPTCSIGGATYSANTIEPGNPCHICDPGLDRTDWSPNAGAFCGDGIQVCCNGSCCAVTECCSLDETCTPCRCDIEGALVSDGTLETPQGCLICDPAQSTSAWSSVLDQSTCGGVPGRVCCNGECCSPTECCTGISCEECGPHCHIGGQDIAAGDANPAKDCEVCNPDLSFDTWSPADDGAACNQGDGCCTTGICGSCSCTIDGKPVADRTDNPRNDCQECIYARNPNDWSNRDNGADCGNDGERDCCDGECCPENQCCTVDGCELCCRIPLMSEPVADGVVNPKNTCQICDAGHEGHDWTILGDGEACGATGNSECCNGECCPSGQCCRNGECGLCDCEIGGHPIAPDTVNDNNPCEICKPALNRFDWSAVTTGTSCDAQGGTCCGRDCCSTDLCCLLDACGDCLCSIENHNYAPKDPNPTVDCQECDPRADPFGWSTSPDRTACGDGTQQCCGGTCCDPGFCCIGGSCQTCGCTIDGQPVAIDAPNPNNPCQKCDPSRDPLGWSSLDEGTSCDESGAQCCKGGECEFCSCLIEGDVIADGAPNPLVECQKCDVGLFPGGWSPSTETSSCGDGTQICCNGACCPAGNCCNLDDICEPCRCEIEGATVEAQTFAPDNLCLFCDPATSTTSWTFGPDYSVCSDPLATINRYCCRGICCQEHECCRSDGTCGPCTCVIEGAGEFQEGDHNPDNDCQFCNPTDNQTGWSVAPDGDICGPNLDQTCCAGRCGPCEPGCLIDGVHYDEFARKPGNFCEYCDPRFPDQWSPSQGGDCPPACLIGGELVRYGTPNPDNPCQICRGGDDWSPSTELFCGEGLGQVCCDGICCEQGACCSVDGVCGFENCEQQGCVIGGVQFEDGTENPDNACQICQVSNSTTEWTAQFGQCGPNFDRFCCDGVCCELGACCTPDQVCDFDTCQTCAIGGVLYFPEDRNPANGCEICSSNQNKFAWTPLPDFSWCDEMQLTTCCSGSCCPPGESCQQGVCQPT